MKSTSIIVTRFTGDEMNDIVLRTRGPEKVHTKRVRPNEVATTKSLEEELKGGELARAALEREIRRYVKKSGGFRKDLNPQDQKRAVALLAIIGRRSITWDLSIHVPGFGDEEFRGHSLVPVKTGRTDITKD